MKAAPLTGKGPVFAALCIDTLGTELQVSDAYVAMLDTAAKSVAEYRKRYDTYAVYQQAAVLDAVSEDEKAAKAEAYKAAAAAVAADIDTKSADGGPDEGASADELEKYKLGIAFEAYKAFVIEQKDALVSYGKLAVVDPVAAKAYATLMLCAGEEPTTVLAQGTGTPVWEKMKFNLAALLDKALQMTPTGARTGLAPRSKLEFYAALEGDDVLASKFVQEMADAAAAEAPLAGVPEIHPVLKLAEMVVALRIADCKVRAMAADFDPATDEDAALFYKPPVAEDEPPPDDA